MKLRWGLLQWQLRSLAPITAVALVVFGGFTLFRPAPFMDRYFSGYSALGGYMAPWVLAGLHALAIAIVLGRVHSGDFGFLHGRGFSRQELWAHTMIASLVSALGVWLVTACVVWLGIRSWVQTYLVRNPEYPVMAPADYPYPWLWLVGYLVAVPVFHYAWIRRAQPARGAANGEWLAAALVVAAFVVLVMTGYRQLWAVQLAVGGAVLLGLIVLVAQYRLYRSLEVRG